MSAHPFPWKTKSLLGLILLAAVYTGWLFLFHSITGIRWVDGSLGVLLGLFICSRPAGNAVDLLFFQRAAMRQISSEWPGVAWLGLNLLVMAIGTLVTILGATRIAGLAL